MIVLENILSQEIVQRLGWTLLHFIWQAVVVSVLLAILLRALCKSSANLRYIISCLALVLIILLPAITIKLIPVSVPQSEQRTAQNLIEGTESRLQEEKIQSSVLHPPSSVSEELKQSESIPLASTKSWKQRAAEFFEPALPYIVSGWLFGVFGLSIWHLGGWTQLQRLRRKMVKNVDMSLQVKLKELAGKLKVKQAVLLLESALVEVPTVVGWLKPVILLPATALTGLSTDQLDAMLAHELAHIKRYDYLVNLLQTVVEILGFYHPAVWWISHKIRLERENCCDDLAVSISGDRVRYARALTLVEEIRASRSELAVAADGGNLFRRIRRLLGKDTARKTGFSWIPAITAILLIIALVIPTTLALTNKSESQESEEQVDVQELKLDALPVGWQLNYDSGERGETKIWRSGMAQNLVELKAVPKPANEYDESWKEERLVFEIRSQNGEGMGSILFWDESKQFDRIILSPGKYLLLYTRERQDPKTSCLTDLNHVEFPADLSRPGMYELIFSPKLETPETTVAGSSSTTCAGKVIDSNGKSLTSAQVAAYETYFDLAGNLKLRFVGEAVTKADGAFLFKTTPSVRKNRSMGGLVVAWKEGLAVGWAHWPLYGSQQATITLQEPTKLSGRIVNESGSSIANAEVRAVLFEKGASQEEETKWLPGVQPLKWLSVRTDRNGMFAFNNIPQNVAADLLAAAPGFGSFYTRKPERIEEGYEGAEFFAAGQTDIKIMLSAEARIKGKVVDEKTGEGVAGITLVVVPYFTPVFFERYTCITKEDGTFEIGGLRSGKYMIRRGGQSSPRIDAVVESGKTTSDVIIKWPHGVQSTEAEPGEIISSNENEQKTDLQVMFQKSESLKKLTQLGLAAIMYADEHDNNLPKTLQELKAYIKDEQCFKWLLDNIEYLGKGKSTQRSPAEIPIAFDKSLQNLGQGTNVLFLDAHVEFCNPDRLKTLSISSGVEKQVESGRELFSLVKALFIYANDHEDKYPDSLSELRSYLKGEDLEWASANVRYLG